MQENNFFLKIFLILIFSVFFVAFIIYLKKDVTPKEITNIDIGKGIKIETDEEIIERRSLLEKVTKESDVQTQKEIDSNLKILEKLNP